MLIDFEALKTMKSYEVFGNDTSKRSANSDLYTLLCHYNPVPFRRKSPILAAGHRNFHGVEAYDDDCIGHTAPRKRAKAGLNDICILMYVRYRRVIC